MQLKTFHYLHKQYEQNTDFQLNVCPEKVQNSAESLANILSPWPRGKGLTYRDQTAIK